MSTAPRVIWVVGMHRSGTSLTAKALGNMGLDLGPSATMVSPDPFDNPTGYWEQTTVVKLNNELLTRMGGPSWAPPPLAAGWPDDPRLCDLREPAREILASLLERGDAVAVKDPRLSLTLPFWSCLAPGPQAAAICIRHPAEVAASLETRDPTGPLDRESWERLWLTYTTSALRSTAALPRAVVFHDVWFSDLERQVAGLATLARRPLLEGRPPGLDATAAFTRDSLRHHIHSQEGEEDPEGAPAVYRTLRRRFEA